MSQVVIVREEFKDSPTLSFLPAFDKVRYSAALECDILFSACRPSLACIFVDLAQPVGDPHVLDQAVARMERVQNLFHNCFAVVLVNPQDITSWNRVQLKLGYGLLRLFHTTTHLEVPQIIYNYFCVMKDSCKLEQQSLYFEEEKLALTSPETAKVIIGETMNRLGVGTAANATDAEMSDSLHAHRSDCPDDITILSDSLPSIGDIIAADHGTLQYVPVAIRILDAVEQFFGFDTTASTAALGNSD